MSLARPGDRRNKRSPVGMTVVSPSESVSPIDSRMTPTRKMLFQRRRLSSQSRKGTSPLEPVQIVEDDTRDDIPLVSNHLRSSSGHKRDGQMKLIQDRFDHIQHGLGTIDEERNQLLERTKELEKEKKLVQKQLELREREILTLVKRCASQEEKMRESSKLRSENRELQHHLDTVQRRLNELGDETEDLYTLKKKLQQSELDREHLQERLIKLQREHDAVTDTLQDCLASIRQLTDEKQHLEEERRRERRRAELELEKQQLAHVAESNNLKKDIRTHQTKILQMEKILQDNMYTNTALRREKAILSQGHHGEVQEVIHQYQRQLAEMRHQIDLSSKEKEEEYERQISLMKRQIEEAAKEQDCLKAQIGKGGSNRDIDFEKEMKLLKEKIEARDHMIEDLETEFSEQMEELMSKQCSLDEAEAERRNLEEKVQAMRNLEIEHSALLDFVQILDSNLADLTCENAHLILEKDTLEEEAEGLRIQSKNLQHQLESLQSSRKARENDFRDLLEAEKEELRDELEQSLAKAKKEIETLHADLDCREEWITMLETELRSSRRQILAKEDEIAEIRNEMDVLRSNLTSALRKARAEVASLEAEVFSHDKNFATIEGRLEIAKVALEDVAKSMDEFSVVNHCYGIRVLGFEGDTLDSATSVAEIKNGPEGLAMDSLALPTTGGNLHDHVELESRLEEAQSGALELQNEIQRLLLEKKILSEEVEKARGVINGRDDQIVSLQQTLLQYKKREKDLTRNVSETGKVVEKREDDSECRSDILKSSFSRIESLESDERVDHSTCTRKESSRLVADLQSRAMTLETDLAEAQRLRDDSVARLNEAQRQILTLEARLAGESRDEYSASLVNQLKEATVDLAGRKEQAQLTELEYIANVQVQATQEINSQEIKARILALEQRILELEDEVKESEERLACNNKIVSDLEAKVLKRDDETKALLTQLDRKKEEKEDLENELTSKNQEIKTLQTDIYDTKALISVKERKIMELELAAEENSICLKRLEEKLSEAIAKIADHEHDKEGSDDKEDRSNDGKNPLEQTKREISELEEKIQALLASQTELATELEKSSNALEQERLDWSTKEDNLEEEMRSLKTELLSVQGLLTDREVRIKKLERDFEKNDEMYKGLESTLEQAHKTIESLMDQKRDQNEKYLALELELSETRNSLNRKYANLEEQHRQSVESLDKKDSLVALLHQQEEKSERKNSALEAGLSDANDEIIKLGLEIKTREEEIEFLKSRIHQLGSSDIETAFVESERRRSSLEADLVRIVSKNEQLTKDLQDRETRLLQVGEELNLAQREVVQKGSELLTSQRTYHELNKRVGDVDKMLDSRDERLMTVESEVASVRRDSDLAKAQELEYSTKSLGEALATSSEAVAHQVNLCSTLEAAVGRWRGDTEDAYHQDTSATEHKIKTLEDALQREVQLRNGLALDFAAVSETLAATQRQKAELQRRLEEKSQPPTLARDELAYFKKLQGSPEFNESNELSNLQSELAKLKTELALRDDEIRELRLVELKDAEETITSLTEDVNVLTEEAFQKNQEKIVEIAHLTAEIERLNDMLQSVTLQKEAQQQQFDSESCSMANNIAVMESSKRKLQTTIDELNEAIHVRDGTIMSLKEALSLVEQREMEMTDERNSLRAAGERGRDEIQNLKDEIELAVAREKELAEIKLRNRDILHKEEMEHAKSQLELAKKKLKESEGLLKERSSLLGEMFDQNKELESRLEKEESDLRRMEGKFAQGRLELEQTKKDLKKCQEDLHRKESILQSKLKEERESKEFAEESLRKIKAKYNEAIKTKKCVTELERQNAELRDKIRRQEAFLQRKLNKEKMERGRATPTKSITSESPANSVYFSKTPTKFSSNPSCGRIPPPASSVFMVPPRGSRLQAPSRSAKNPVASPLTRTYQQSSTPFRKSSNPTSSDRSVTSELSSLLRTPTQIKDHRDQSPVVPSWEMDLG
jgi:chromosome segregation ATPase